MPMIRWWLNVPRICPVKKYSSLPSAQQILLSSRTHYFNVNSLLGPWQGFDLSAGARLGLIRQDAWGNVNYTFGDPAIPLFLSDPATLDSDIDRTGLEENVVLRYTTIPHTVLYAETRLKQEAIDHHENQVGGEHELLRETDADSRGSLYRTGFNVSPWRRVSFHASYTRNLKKNRYHHDLDEAPLGFPGIGYSAFIRAHDFISDEIETKLVLRPALWLRTTLSWKLLASDYKTATDDVDVAPDIVPGGRILSGNYDANIYSLGVALTLSSRFYLSSTFSYADSRTLTQDHGSPAIVAFLGDIYTLNTSGTYALTEKTDLFAGYTFSRADYSQDNLESGLPLGPDYGQHAAQIGLSFRCSEHVTTAIRYSYFRFGDSWAGEVNDYSAHAIFASLSFRWPNPSQPSRSSAR